MADTNSIPVADQDHAWLGGELFFAADDGTGDVEVWKTDGTAAGTIRVADIRTGESGSFPKSFVALHERVFFTAYDDETGRELWSTDAKVIGS
ncbi:MAG: hypothetical protein KDA87_26210 [Planctomycetales bacterium]|nr:hypothetical protein [Planctomycetales bacterium]